MEETINIILIIIGGLVFFLGIISEVIKKLSLSEPVVALALGILLSPAVLGIFDINVWSHELLEETARLAAAVGVMGVALRVPSSYTRGHWRSVAVMLGIAMSFRWLASSLLVYWFTDFEFIVALLIGAIITPTDPILTLSVVSGKLAEKILPSRLRNLLLTESGSNEGLAYLFVIFPILLTNLRTAEALNFWLVHAFFLEAGLSIILGAAAGYVSGRMLKSAERKGTIDISSYYAYCLALTLLVLGGVKLAGGDGILAVFVAGTIFSMVSTEEERHEEEHVVEGVDRFFMIPIFTLLGLVLPWQEWIKLGWEGPVLAFLVLLLHRLPVLLFIKSHVPDIRSNLEMLFVGWFGPVGIGAFYYSQVSMRQTGIMEIWPVVSLIVCVSTVLHGITATPFIKYYGKHTAEELKQSSDLSGYGQDKSKKSKA